MADNESHSQKSAKNESAFAYFRDAWNDGNHLDPDEYCRNHPECSVELHSKIEKFLFVAGGLLDLRQGRASQGCDDEQGLPLEQPTPAEDPLEESTTLGDFRLIRSIGAGGMGEVYEAEQTSLHRRVALKILPPHLSLSEAAISKFRREAEAGGRQSHPGIVAVFAMGEHDGVHYIAQELVPGAYTMADKLNDLRQQEHQKPGYFRQVARLILKVAEALEHAHRSGVVHRDVKPSNILLTAEGRPKITDFGLAKVQDALALSRAGDFAGTPYYMSPEQAASHRIGIDHRTDIFSLGVTFYEFLTLRRPFEGDSTQEVLKKILLQDPRDPRWLNPKVPRDLAVICLKSMEKQPENRFASMAELAAELERFLNGDVILSRSPRMATRLLKRVQRNPGISAALGLAFLCALALVLYTLWSYPKILLERNRVLRLADAKRLAQLEERAGKLWPVSAAKVDAFEAWLRDAKELQDRIGIHQQTLQDLRAGAERIDGGSALEEPQAWLFPDTEAQWQHDTLDELVVGLTAFSDPQTGTVKSVRDRLYFARSVYERSILDYAEAWQDAVESIADETICPLYGGLTITPQVGLVPLGRDPCSGLWEFAHLQTGTSPERGADGRLVLHAESGLVFVLIPGGCLSARAALATIESAAGEAQDATRSGGDKDDHHTQIPVAPLFVSKYEWTQAQWQRITGLNPSIYVAQQTAGSDPFEFVTHPVENVSFEECVGLLKRLALRLPTEIEWEYAARGGTTTIWWTGDDVESLANAANLADRSCQMNGGAVDWIYEEWLIDGYNGHAPVDAFNPNPFGLHSVLGNVWEWCLNSFPDVKTVSAAWMRDQSITQITRGGGWNVSARRATCAFRRPTPPGLRGVAVGFRPVRDLDTEPPPR